MPYQQSSEEDKPTSLSALVEKKYGPEGMQGLESLMPNSDINKKMQVIALATQILGTDAQGKLRPFEDLYKVGYFMKQTGLDPMRKQFHVVYRNDYKTGKDQLAIQISIDGLRSVAGSSKFFGGIGDITYEGEIDEDIQTGSGQYQKTLKVKHPEVARAEVYRLNAITGERMPIVASARWDEYYPGSKQGSFWHTKPYLMLGKCAEALALRKAFPQELGGLYTDDEMAQADKEKPEQRERILLPRPQKFTPTLDQGQKPIEVTEEAVIAPPPPPSTTTEMSKEEQDSFDQLMNDVAPPEGENG